MCRGQGEEGEGRKPWESRSWSGREQEAFYPSEGKVSCLLPEGLRKHKGGYPHLGTVGKALLRVVSTGFSRNAQEVCGLALCFLVQGLGWQSVCNWPLTVDVYSLQDSLAEVEEKYKKAMVSNAQLDNEKTNFMYQVDTLKDALLELEEQLAESRRQYEEKSKVGI